MKQAKVSRLKGKDVAYRRMRERRRRERLTHMERSFRATFPGDPSVAARHDDYDGTPFGHILAELQSLRDVIAAHIARKHDMKRTPTNATKAPKIGGYDGTLELCETLRGRCTSIQH